MQSRGRPQRALDRRMPNQVSTVSSRTGLYVRLLRALLSSLGSLTDLMRRRGRTAHKSDSAIRYSYAVTLHCAGVYGVCAVCYALEAGIRARSAWKSEPPAYLSISLTFAPSRRCSFTTRSAQHMPPIHTQRNSEDHCRGSESSARQKSHRNAVDGDSKLICYPPEL